MAATAEVLTPIVFKRRRFSARRAWLLLFVIILTPVGIEGYRIAFGSNFHTVVPGRVYRCAQPSGSDLEEMIANYGIRTVVNLRGSCETVPWYWDETRETHNNQVCHENVCMSAGRLPSVTEVRHLIEILDGTEYPIVLHCRRGADRTGLAAAIVLLLTTDTPLDEACEQLSWRYGHVAWGRPAQLNLFLEFYRNWLSATGQRHTKETFRNWALHEYRPGSCSCELTLKQPAPSVATTTDHTTIHVIARNTGILPWRLKPFNNAGVHLGCHIYDEQDVLQGVVKTGLRDATVLPGETLELTLVVVPLYKSGRYRLQLDMVDEQACWFFQTGSRPLELELIVRE